MPQYIATIGFFDGVHRGHRYLLDFLKQSSDGLQTAVVTFKEHPQKVLQNATVPLLTTHEERIKLLEQQNLSLIKIYPFAEIAALRAEEFMAKLHSWGVRKLVLGYNHTFGSDGKTANYDELGQKIGIEIVRFNELQSDLHISSSQIRKYLLAGEMEKANLCLGYSYTLNGTVVKGFGQGHTIGFPTANLSIPAEKLQPCDGVYAVECQLDDQPQKTYKGIMNIGQNPTFEHKKRSIEIHIIDFNSNIYDKQITVKMLHYIRPEKKFENTAELKQQIEKDLAQAIAKMPKWQ